MSSADYLTKPYARCLVPDETGGYVATIQEFPGCVAEGETPNEALESLEAAATSWIDAALASGQSIPEPMGSHGYSGKVVLRMPRSLHKQAAERAAVESTSLNQLLVTAVATYLGARASVGSSNDVTAQRPYATLSMLSTGSAGMLYPYATAVWGTATNFDALTFGEHTSGAMWTASALGYNCVVVTRNRFSDVSGDFRPEEGLTRPVAIIPFGHRGQSTLSTTNAPTQEEDPHA